MPSGLKARYTQIKNDIIAYKKRITIPNMSGADMEGLMRSLLFESPELFFIELHSIAYGTLGYMMAMEPRYFHLGEETRVTARLNEAIKEIGKKRNAYEQVIAIVKWMYRLRYVNNASPDDHTIYGPLMKGEGVCEGFSMVFMILCLHFGIDAMVAFGNIVGATDAHAWNIVSINGRKYNVDMTSAIAAKKEYGFDYVDVLVPDYMISNHLSPQSPYCGVLSDNPYYRVGRGFTTLEELKEAIKTVPATEKEFYLLDCSEEGINVIERFDSLKGAGNIGDIQSLGRMHHFIRDSSGPSSLKSLLSKLTR